MEILMFILVPFIVGAVIIFFLRKKSFKENKISFREAMDLADLPIITLKQGDKKINFLLDTGSTMSIITTGVLEGLEYTETGELGTVYGMEGNVIDTKYINMNVMYKDITYNENFQVVDMTSAFNSIKQSTGVTISGILGNSFFTKYKYVLNFDELIAYSLA